MSRSRRKTPIVGHATCRSEREDKKLWHQRWRSRERSALASAPPEALAAAFDSAAYSVACAEEAHAHYGDPEPTPGERWTYWWRGFIAGLAGDSNFLPLSERFSRLLPLSSLRRIEQETRNER
ncbi:hypothetical protein APB34_33680 [Pseudomonas aeruginosa]|jgi:hypothetical protein|uniref:Uncharacterized protein n=1 Tax=Pseudomonas aeruginosa TaxID=287 RepID=A0A367M4E3_PSEAI|nr:hypothetical protein AM490_00180 [Pseudomonas aeruginosa]AZM87046.1 hypothetical protein EIP87_34075 [Pseudomonas aeruginosa]KAB0727886.1 hypothetical protein F7O90_18475 [Pseudomonas aeruginosa]OPD74681.1 hypothetical protein AO910_33890 [Pseudomonas aeruginosa]OPD85103.1 hypothetical protein AO946_36840 [Pseudomonas aeruginosa]